MHEVSAAIRTDLYELTMMQGYWAHGRADQRAAFELFFRAVPDSGGYAIACGLEDALDQVEKLAFTSTDLDYLRSLGLFQERFLEYLRGLRFTGQIRSIPEGTVIFPNEPLLEVVAPLPEAQWIESILLNAVNFQTLIATKASRVVQAAHPATVIEFGLRRAHGPDAARWASRASYLAGCMGTSNVEGGAIYGIPVFGTHAHSWIQSFPTELEAFRAYGDLYPDSSILLIDTYDTLLEGLPAAITEAKRLESAGHRLRAVRLDSGDLAYLSKECRKRLDAAGLQYVKIIASSDIDEYLLQELKLQSAPIDSYGVGTRLVTAFSAPALGGVYKLVAIEEHGHWRPKIKISSNPIKTTIPGRKQIHRWESGWQYLGDALAAVDESPPAMMRHPDIEYKRTNLPRDEIRPLLEIRTDQGRRVIARPTLEESRAHAAEEIRKLPAEHRRLANPHTYRVGLSEDLYQCRRRMIEEFGEAT